MAFEEVFTLRAPLFAALAGTAEGFMWPYIKKMTKIICFFRYIGYLCIGVRYIAMRYIRMRYSEP